MINSKAMLEISPKSKKQNKVSIILLLLGTFVFSLPYLFPIFLIKDIDVSFQFGQYVGSFLILFVVPFLVYRFIRGKLEEDINKNIKKISRARFWAIIILLIFGLMPIIRFISEAKNFT